MHGLSHVYGGCTHVDYRRTDPRGLPTDGRTHVDYRRTDGPTWFTDGRTDLRGLPTDGRTYVVYRRTDGGGHWRRPLALQLPRRIHVRLGPHHDLLPQILRQVPASRNMHLVTTKVLEAIGQERFFLLLLWSLVWGRRVVRPVCTIYKCHGRRLAVGWW